MSNEPVAIGGALVALVTAVLGLLVAFNVDITDAQKGAIVGVVVALIALVTIVVRSKVTPTNKLP